MAGSIRDIDKGYTKWVKAQRKLAKSSKHVAVGFLERAGKHKGTDLSVAQVATFHEYGVPSKKIPERSMLRSTMDDKREEIGNFIERAYIATPDDIDTVLNLTGLKAVSMVKARFTDNNWPRLKRPRPQGGENPLLDTGQTRASVQHEVREGSGK